MKRFNFHQCGNFKASYEEELTVFQTDFGRLWLIIGLIVLFGFMPLLGNSHLLRVLELIGIYSIAAIGLNILTGYTGMISLGHSALFGLGAYTVVILVNIIKIPVWLTVPAAGLISAIVGAMFGLPAMRLMGFYLCFATLACQKIIEFLFIHWKGITGGAEGISIEENIFPGTGVKDDIILFYIVFILMTLMTLLAVNLLRSRFGRAFRAIRDDQRAAEVIGIPAFKYKLLSFTVSSFYAGIAGALFAFYKLNISPQDFDIAFSIILIAMIIIGGMGSVPGSIFGAVVIVLLKEVSVFGERLLAHMLDISFSASSLFESAAGLLIALFIIFKPEGLAGTWRDIRSIFRSWPLRQGVVNGFNRSLTVRK